MPKPMSFHLWKALHRKPHYYIRYNTVSNVWRGAAIILVIVAASQYDQRYSNHDLLLLFFLNGLLTPLATAAGLCYVINANPVKMELVSITPRGKSLLWRWAAHFTRTNFAFNLVRWLAMLVPLYYLVAYGERIFDNSSIDNYALFNAVALMVLILGDYFYTTVSGAMFGLLSSTLFGRRFFGALLATALAMGLQVLLYVMLFGGLANQVYNLVSRLLYNGYWQSSAYAATLTVIALYFLLREIVAVILWFILSRRLEMAFSDLTDQSR